jgi:hypothetical protein
MYDLTTSFKSIEIKMKEKFFFCERKEGSCIPSGDMKKGFRIHIDLYGNIFF